LWQTKLRSITVLEKWLAKTGDSEIKAGLQMQLVDERRHLRLIGDEIKRLGGSIATLARGNLLGRPFALVQAQPNDNYRLSVFHHGIKAFSLERCSHLLAFVDEELSQTLQQIVFDEERHIRWADLRMSRKADEDEQRRRQLLLERIEIMLKAAWPRPWLELPRSRFISVVGRG
jgi:hypothetical protein